MIAPKAGGCAEVAQIIDFQNVSTSGLESSPVAAALAGLRANEARYFMNKYGHAFTTLPAAESEEALAYVDRILREERGLTLSARALETSRFEVAGIAFTYVFYEDGLALNVMYELAEGGKRAVGFKLSAGMPVPAELEGRFKFATQRSKLAGTIRGSFFVIKGTY